MVAWLSKRWLEASVLCLCQMLVNGASLDPLDDGLLRGERNKPLLG